MALIQEEERKFSEKLHSQFSAIKDEFERSTKELEKAKAILAQKYQKMVVEVKSKENVIVNLNNEMTKVKIEMETLKVENK